MLPFNWLPSAQHDFDESFDWYAERSAFVAQRFANAVDSALARIARNPQVLAQVDRVHQECPVKKFPFRVVFRQLEDQTLIVAIAHAKRRPAFWQGRA